MKVAPRPHYTKQVNRTVQSKSGQYVRPARAYYCPRTYNNGVVACVEDHRFDAQTK